MRISLAVVGAAAAWPPLSQIGSDATSFCEGVGTQLASNALGSDGMTAVQDTVDAAGDVGTAAEETLESVVPCRNVRRFGTRTDLPKNQLR